MEETSTKTQADGTALFAGDAWFDPIEAGIRDRVRGFIEELIGQELDAALGRGRYERDAETPIGYRNGTRERQLLGSFGPVALSVPRARMTAEGGGTQEWRSATLPRYARMTKQVETLIAGAYLAGTNTRRVKRALAALFGGAAGKDVVSRTWRKVKTDWDAWNGRDLAGEGIVRLILDGTVVRVRLDRKATNISLLVVLGVRRDGQKVLLAVKNMGVGASRFQRRSRWNSAGGGGKRGRVARRAGRPDRPWPAHAGVPDHRRRSRVEAGAGGAVPSAAIPHAIARGTLGCSARRAGPALHSPQASQPPGPRA